jgi:hypothetical protein
MGMLLKLAVFGVAAYMVWNTARRWLGLLGGKGSNLPPNTSRRSPTRPTTGAGPTAPPKPVVEDTRRCPVCGAYVSISASKCSRPDCPQS